MSRLIKFSLGAVIATPIVVLGYINLKAYDVSCIDNQKHETKIIKLSDVPVIYKR